MQKISLPIDSHLEKIANSFNHHKNIILTSPPGTGKTSRVPAHLMNYFKKIVVLVPRRIAAISSANRICEENGLTLGHEVGYQVRFENKSTESTRLIFMTEGVFVKKLQNLDFLNNLDLIIFDEFHERSSLSDLSLGICYEKQILEQKLQLLIMSATLNVDQLRNYLNNCSHIELQSTNYPVEVIKSKKPQRLICDQIFIDNLIETLKLATLKSKKDILIFLPGLGEIRFVERNLQNSRFQNFEIHTLHSSVNLDDQKKILNFASQRRIILSTNIAESSITIPSIDCVIDSGLEKNSNADLKLGFKGLEISRISLFSAQQRRGRAGRVGPGYCYQLWHELDERSMPEQIQPEILESNLLEECLLLNSLNIENPDQFTWLTKPKKKFTDALEQLDKWKLLNSEKARLVQACPLDIERSLLFVELSLRGLQKEASRLLAFLETVSFEKLTSVPELENLPLKDFALQIEKQLLRINIESQNKQTFTDAIVEIFFEKFPYKIAKTRDKNTAVSSLGRGVELAPFLVKNPSDYYLLLSGRNHSDAQAKCDFAIGFSNADFLKFSQNHIQLTETVEYDPETQRFFRIEKKMAGLFVLSQSTKTYLNKSESTVVFKNEFLKNPHIFLLQHPQFNEFKIKLDFLNKHRNINFDFVNDLKYDLLITQVDTPEDFFSSNLYNSLMYLSPETIRQDLNQLPDYYELPNGKKIKIDYAGEQSPKVSARIQDFFGVHKNPSLLNNTIKLTIELLAPNNRPTQITSQLENFWNSSYHDIKKELKARYPKHAWPEDPANYKIIKKT